MVLRHGRVFRERPKRPLFIHHGRPRSPVNHDDALRPCLNNRKFSSAPPRLPRSPSAGRGNLYVIPLQVRPPARAPPAPGRITSYFSASGGVSPGRHDPWAKNSMLFGAHPEGATCMSG